MATGVGKTAASAPAPRKRRGRTIKACEGCRALKTRCQFSGASLICDKCIELNRPCTMLPSAANLPRPARKRRSAGTKSPGAGAGADAATTTASARRASAPRNPSGVVPVDAADSVDSVDSLDGSELDGSADISVSASANALHAPPPLASSFASSAPASSASSAASSMSSSQGPHAMLADPRYLPQQAYHQHQQPHQQPYQQPYQQQQQQQQLHRAQSSISTSASASASRPASEQITGEDSLFDTRFPAFDMRAVLDPGTFVPDPSPIPSEDLEIPNLLDPEFPELFLGMEAEFSQSESPEIAQEAAASQPHTTNPRNRIRFNFSPMYMALRLLDPSLQSSFGIASRLLKPRSLPAPARNVISQGVLTRPHAVELINVFKLHLNHWLIMPMSNDTEVLVDHLLHKCPLLITVCCAVALRLCSRDVWSRYYPAVVDYMSKELSMTLARSPQSIEGLQAIMILALYGSSLSYQDYVFDMWYLSGIGVQHCMTNTAVLDTLAHHHLGLWNHLVHVHVHCSVMTGRLPMIDDQCVDLCRRILKEPFADRFDSCILTEVLMYDLALQRYRNRITYDEFTKKVEEWQNEWSLVLSMATVQFSDTARFLLEFNVRVAYLRRQNQPPSPSPASAATLVDNYIMPVASNHEAVGNDLLTAQWFETLPTHELLKGLSQLGSCISGIVMPAAGRLFRFLSDLIHDVAFTAAVLAVVIRKILAKRTDVTPDAEGVMSDAVMLPRRLAELFHATSRGADIQQSRCFALVRLLQGVN